MKRAFAWLDDCSKTSAWIERPELNLRKRLLEGNGFVKIHGFLPEEVAEGVRLVLEEIPVEKWERAGEGHRDDAGYADRVQHGFSTLEVENHEILLGVGRVLAQLLPGTLPNFSAARYNRSDHIMPHDDLVPESYTEAELQRIFVTYGIDNDSSGAQGKLGLKAASESWRDSFATSANLSLEEALQSGDLEAVRMAVEAGGKSVSEGSSIPCTRLVAMAYYLTREWKREYGGLFADMQDKSEHVPEFNTLVAFEVPRMHEVTAVNAPPGCFRHSIFGWWLSRTVEPHCRTSRKRPSAANAVTAAKRPAGNVRK